MNVIDLEILIPASPEFIWRFMGDLSAIPQWYDEVVSISFLSTQREGRGTRWRHSTAKGNDVIVEVSAWYDTLGYEYRVVDGTTYSENQGRIRLQEVSDGTLVRWTFQYDASGVLGGLRNTMRLKRNATNQIQDSLRNLHQLILQESGGISTHEAKASMQDAPDVSERSHYQPRHPSAFRDADADEETALSELQSLSYDLEQEPEPLPAVIDTDTKPNPVVLGAIDDAVPAIDSAPEPALDDTRPIEVESLLAELPALAAERSAPAPEPEPEPAAPAPLAVVDEAPPPAEAALPRAPADSSHLSVFEIFGLQKPSEAKAEQADEPASDRPAFRRERDLAPSARGDSRQIGAADRQAMADEAPKPEAQSGASTVILGWRRGARRRKTLLRSHT